MFTLLPKLGDPAALGRVGVPPGPPPPIRGELFGQVEAPKRPSGTSMDPVATLGQELVIGFVVGWLLGKDMDLLVCCPTSSSSSLTNTKKTLKLLTN